MEGADFNWGSVGVAIGGILLYLYDKLQKRREKAKEKVEAAAKKIEIFEKNSAASGIEVFMQVDKQVRHVEVRIAQICQANKKPYPLRVFVIHFHNGQFTDAGLSLLKMTIQHELTSSYAIWPLHKNHYGTPVPSFLGYLIRLITLKGENYIEDTEQIKNKNIPLYEWLINYDIKSMLSLEIKSNKSGRIVAILCVQFDQANAIDRETIVEIKEQKKRIEAEYDKLEPKQY